MATEISPAPVPPAGLTDDTMVFFDGAFMPLRQATVSVATHALHYGTGCFEGLRGYWCDDQQEMYVLRLEEHVARFFRSCAMLRLVPPFTQAEFGEIILESVRMNGYRCDVYIRPLGFKSSPTIKLTLSALDDSFAVYAFPFGHYVHREGGLHVTVSAWRRIDDNAIPTRAKVTGGYVNSSLATDAAFALGYDEALLLNQNGSLSEASSANVFLVRGTTLVTPDLSESILEGITRDAVLTLAREELGLRVEERPVGRGEIYVADEMFLTGTGVQIGAVTQVDGRPVGAGIPGPVTTRLEELYGMAVRGRLARYASWCTPVYTGGQREDDDREGRERG